MHISLGGIILACIVAWILGLGDLEAGFWRLFVLLWVGVGAYVVFFIGLFIYGLFFA